MDCKGLFRLWRPCTCRASSRFPRQSMPQVGQRDAGTLFRAFGHTYETSGPRGVLALAPFLQMLAFSMGLPSLFIWLFLQIQSGRFLDQRWE